MERRSWVVALAGGAVGGLIAGLVVLAAETDVNWTAVEALAVMAGLPVVGLTAWATWRAATASERAAVASKESSVAASQAAAALANTLKPDIRWDDFLLEHEQARGLVARATFYGERHPGRVAFSVRTPDNRLLEAAGRPDNPTLATWSADIEGLEAVPPGGVELTVIYSDAEHIGRWERRGWFTGPPTPMRDLEERQVAPRISEWRPVL